MRWSLPNLISASRFALALLIAWSILTQAYPTALWVFSIAVASDLLDGAIARRRGQVSSLGTLLDHGADACFVSAAGFALAKLDTITMLLPTLIVLAFAQYALERTSGEPLKLRASLLGRYNGIAYYALIGMAIVVQIVAPTNGTLAILIHSIAWLLVATSLISMITRLRTEAPN